VGTATQRLLNFSFAISLTFIMYENVTEKRVRPAHVRGLRKTVMYSPVSSNTRGNKIISAAVKFNSAV
jgi:hypothetical protein